MRRSAVPRKVNSYDQDAPVPAIRSRWIWDPGHPSAQETITVIAVEWNGEEWWVQTISDSQPRVGFFSGRLFGTIPGKKYWNDLGRFWEAVEPIEGKS